jgi:hypothetical protein
MELSGGVSDGVVFLKLNGVGGRADGGGEVGPPAAQRGVA